MINPKIKVAIEKGLLIKLKEPFLTLATRYEKSKTEVTKKRNKNFAATIDWSKIGRTPIVVQINKISNNGKTETFGRNFFIVVLLDQIWGIYVK